MVLEIKDLFNELKNKGYVNKYIKGEIEFIDFVALDECTEYLNNSKCELQKFMYDIEMLLFNEICEE